MFPGTYISIWWGSVHHPVMPSETISVFFRLILYCQKADLHFFVGETPLSKSIPFKITAAYQGFGEVDGLIRLEKNGLRIESQAKDNFIGLIKSQIKQLFIPLDSLEEVGFKKSIFGNKLILRVSSLEMLSQFPYHDMGEIVLPVKRKHVEAAMSLVSQIKLNVADKKYREACDMAV